MFGYVRPYRPELKCKDFDLYHATYCGLCRCLRRRYGNLAPFFLTYDAVFLALLLWEPKDSFLPCKGRCYANPLRKKAMCPACEALELTADFSVILTYWKLKDGIQDEALPGQVASRTFVLLMKSAYRRAAARQSALDQTVQTRLRQLSELEREQCPSLDRTADTFAGILRAAAPQEGERGRILGELLYHIGRWIYLIDAQDDLQEDVKEGRYNPVALRYGAAGDPDGMALTLTHSLELAGAAFQLGQFGCRTPVLENILYLGLPLVQKAVFDGSWAQIKKQKLMEK